MKKLLFILFLIPTTLFAEEKPDSLLIWKFGGVASFNFSQVSLTNWAAGGRSSTSGVALFNVFGNYKKDRVSWENSLDLGYGLLKEQDNAAVKSNDKIDLNSKFGLAQTQKLFYSALFNFRTQFAPGYKYPNTDDAISRFMAPGYSTLSLGIDYKPAPIISIFISPFSAKMTFVADDSLSAIGAFGVDPGKRFRTEFGSFAKIEVKTEVMKNVNLQSKVDLFSNYLKHPQNIDINWDLLLIMKINDYLSANLITNLIYDDDIKTVVVRNNDGTTETGGAKVQFKEMFGVGLSVKF